MPYILNKKHNPITAESVYIGRPSIWGNPFIIGKDGTRDEVIDKYRTWILQQPNLLARLPEIKNRNLVCWCAPFPCHGDILLELANKVMS